jgi:hypothetical protein
VATNRTHRPRGMSHRRATDIAKADLQKAASRSDLSVRTPGYRETP